MSDCTVSFRPAKPKPPAGVLIDSGEPQRITRTIDVRDGAIRLRSHDDPNRRLVTRISYIRIQRK
ncbi:MAG: hypothetical protein KAX78_02365 [Phycisphaerae bacterium]|nr:hypothetical protein [Phycisphaerae bacterium]